MSRKLLGKKLVLTSAKLYPKAVRMIDVLKRLGVGKVLGGPPSKKTLAPNNRYHLSMYFSEEEQL